MRKKKLSRKDHDAMRQFLIKIFDEKCMRCNGNNEDLYSYPPQKVALCLDHVKPSSKKGKDHIFNRQLLCHRCNAGKKDKNTDYRPSNFRKLVLDNMK